MARLVQYDPGSHADDLRRLITAYLEEGAIPLGEAGVSEDIPGIVEDDLAHADQFIPPRGCLLMAISDHVAVGCGAMRLIAPDIAEIKRMYLSPELRGRGIGRLMIDRLLEEAREFGCRECRLDSGWLMTDAHRLYRAAGFVECEPYAGSEIPADFDARWMYVRRDLEPAGA